MSLRILMIDDSSEEELLMRHALEQSGDGASLLAVRDVPSGVRYLRGKGQFQDRGKFPLPDVILCDLKMDGEMAGFDFLRWRRQHSGCVLIPTIIYSSSGDERDVEQSYELGANAYIEKPTTLERAAMVIETTCRFWSLCKRPSMKENFR